MIQLLRLFSCLGMSFLRSSFSLSNIGFLNLSYLLLPILLLFFHLRIQFQILPLQFSIEFSLPFSFVDLAIPPDKFPNLVHSDSAHSPYVLVNFLILFLLLYLSYHLLEDILGLINHLFIFMTIIVILHLLMCWPLLLYLNLMILLFLLMCQWSSLPNSVVQWVRMFLILPCTEG